jgi:hypothetical protein
MPTRAPSFFHLMDNQQACLYNRKYTFGQQVQAAQSIQTVLPALYA